MLIVTPLASTCVLIPLRKPSTPILLAQYKCKGGQSMKLAADPVMEICLFTPSSRNFPK